jgi:hypothetical protein
MKEAGNCRLLSSRYFFVAFFFAFFFAAIRLSFEGQTPLDAISCLAPPSHIASTYPEIRSALCLVLHSMPT